MIKQARSPSPTVIAMPTVMTMSPTAMITAMLFDRCTSRGRDVNNINKSTQLTKPIKKPTVLMSIASLWPLQSTGRSGSVFVLAVDDVNTGSIVCIAMLIIVSQLSADYYYNIRPFSLFIDVLSSRICCVF